MRPEAPGRVSPSSYRDRTNASADAVVAAAAAGTSASALSGAWEQAETAITAAAIRTWRMKRPLPGTPDYPCPFPAWQSRLASSPRRLLDRNHHDRPRVSPDFD